MLKKEIVERNKKCGCECHYKNGELRTNNDHHWCWNCNEKHLNDSRHGQFKNN